MISTQQTGVTDSTSKNSSQTITDMLKNWKVPNIAIFKEMVEDAVGAPWHEILFMIGK